MFNPRAWIRIAISLAIFAVFLLHANGTLRIGLLQQLEHLAYDLRVNLTMPGGVDERVVIVDIDDQSLAEEGQWPWSRDRLALMVDRLFEDYDVRALAFDVVFAEPDRSSELDLLERLANGPLSDNQPFVELLSELRPRLDYDRRFAESLAGRPVVLGHVFKDRVGEGEQRRIGALPEPLIPGNRVDGWRVPYVVAEGFTGNLPVLVEHARAGGFFDNPLVDDDGVFRRVPVLQAYEGDLYPSLALATTRLVLGQPPVSFDFDPPDVHDGLHLDAVKLGERRIPVDENLAMLVPYRGPQGSFPYVSAHRVIDGSAPREVLEGSIALVGASAPGLLDLRATPVGKPYVGVEIHANMIAGMLDGRIKHRPQYTLGIEVTTLFLLGLLMTLALPALSPLSGLLATIGLALVEVAVNVALWDLAGLVVPLATPLAFILVLFLFQTIFGFFVESRGKRRLSRLFGQYVPPELVEEMDRRGGQFSLDAESRELTVLFSDVRGFTSISEGLDPKALSGLMNEFLTPMTRVIHAHRGTIDKYMGDAIMAFWGAPLQDPGHARHALEAAMEMARVTDDLAQRFRARGWPEIRIGVGLNTGVMSVGNMGSQFRMAYTALGDAVNLGSRLEGLTKLYGETIVVSETTAREVPDHAFLELDRVRVKGKQEPVRIFAPLGPRDAVDSETRGLVRQHRRALKLYRSQDWDAAERELFTLRQAMPGRAGLYDLYLERVQRYRNSPPGQDWDGVFDLDTK